MFFANTVSKLFTFRLKLSIIAQVAFVVEPRAWKGISIEKFKRERKNYNNNFFFLVKLDVEKILWIKIETFCRLPYKSLVFCDFFNIS
jgi:hypothetical protein